MGRESLWLFDVHDGRLVKLGCRENQRLKADWVDIILHWVSGNLVVWGSVCEHVRLDMGDSHTPTLQGPTSLGPCQRVGLGEGSIGLRTQEKAGVELISRNRVGAIGLYHDIRMFDARCARIWDNLTCWFCTG